MSNSQTNPLPEPNYNPANPPPPTPTAEEVPLDVPQEDEEEIS